MSKQVKCKHCKKSIDKESAYKEEYLTSSLAIRYRYYCNEDCYNESIADKLNKELDKAKLKELKRMNIEIFSYIMDRNMEKDLLFRKYYKDIHEIYGEEVINYFLKNEQEHIINRISNVDFVSEPSKMMYLFKMIQGELPQYKKLYAQYKDNQNKKNIYIFDENNEINFDNIKVKKNKKKSLEDMLDDLE